jgi:uncharacterized phage-associated protein
MIMSGEPRFEFDREKFKVVVHYICSRCEPDELGNVKLHKILYFSDMLHYLSTLKPLTGAEYQKQQFGPTARHLAWALKELEKEEKIKIEKRDYYGYIKSDYISLAEPESNRLTNSEINLLNDVIDFVSKKTAKEISELSHDIAWKSVNMGETIPYYLAHGFIPSYISEEDINEAIAFARQNLHLIYAKTSC